MLPRLRRLARRAIQSDVEPGCVVLDPGSLPPSRFRARNLYVFGGANGLSIAESSDHYAVMTQPPSNTSLQWLGINHEEMVVLNASGISRFPDFTASVSGEEESPVIPEELIIDPAYPNPFNGGISFRLTATGQSPVSVIIYSLMGEKIEQFKFDNIVTPGVRK